MSTLSGQASKGEKTKSKFQSLDINNLYRVSRGENTEKQQTKSSSVFIKHGMQSLGKVPSARRAPANLPSLKSEHSETGAAVPLVPPGGPGWGKQDSTSTASPASNTTTSSQPPVTQQGNAPSLQPPTMAVPAASATVPPHSKPPSLTSASPATSDKLWSSITSGSDPLHPPPYQSPQFQHEFPSLSSGDGGPTRTGSDAQYTSGLSLRPQTEGSWTQGGTRPGASDGPQRPGSGPMGAPPQLAAPVGLPPQQPLPPQFRTVLPPFMYKGNFQQTGTTGMNQSQNNVPPPVNGRNRPDNRAPRLTDTADELTPRPIIKEEELSRMDEISNDMGWAIQDEIDYNQKLAFSDDENESSSKRQDGHREPRGNRDSRDRDVREKSLPTREQRDRERELDRSDSHSSDSNRNWSGRSVPSRGRSSEEEDMRVQRRTQQEVDLAVQRAKQRKEEEEKRFNEATKQGAAKKLMELEEKIQKRDRVTEGSGTINPAVVPSKPISHAPIPLPDFQKEKERERDIDANDDKHAGAGQNRNENSFRHLTQIEGKNFPRKHPGKPENRDRDRDNRGDVREQQNGPFSKHFQNDLPPRFMKHRNNSNSNLQSHPPPPQQSQHSHYNQFDNNRWQQNNSGTSNTVNKTSPNINRNIRDSPEDDERRDYKRQSSEDSYRSVHSHSQSELSKQNLPNDNRFSEESEARHHGYDYNRGDEKWQKEKERPEKKTDQQYTDHRDIKREEKSHDRYERPQRPDSRDSRSRHSRDSEPRDYMSSWSEQAYEPYEDKRKDHIREDRRAVPGPITKDRIEADDLRNEKRNLTQLNKRGQTIEKKIIDSGKREDKNLDELDLKKSKDIVDAVTSNAWADSIPTSEDSIDPKFLDDKSIKVTSNTDLHKVETKSFGQVQEIKKLEKNDRESEYKDRNQIRNNRGPHSTSKGGWGNEYHRSAPWNNKRPMPRSHKPGGRPNSQIGGDYHCTDSEGSMDDHSDKSKKLEKDEKNREMKYEHKSDGKYDKREGYVPRGEPSRYGRGGTFNRNTRLGLSKKIDGYGPPPKSPFGHHDEKDKKASSDEASCETGQVEDKIKQNQQALAAGIIGSSRREHDDKNKIRKDNRRGKSRSKKDDEVYDTNSELSDEKDGKTGIKKSINKKPIALRNPSNSGRRNNPPPRMGGEKRYGDNPIARQNSSNSLPQSKKDEKINEQNVLCNAIADITLKNDASDEKEEKVSINGGDTEGFQEVKSKKTVKERQKSAEDKTKGLSKVDKEKDRVERKKPQLTPHQIQNIPPLMATPVNPPQVLPKKDFERPRQNKLAPRFAKQKLQKAQMQQQHHMHDVNDINKVNQNINVYGMKDTVSAGSAWDKPLSAQMRSMDHENIIGVAIDNCKVLEPNQIPPQGSSPNTDKMMSKSQMQDKTLLDGTTPPVNTIIFENTNFKSAPGSRNSRNDKPRKMDDGTMDNSAIGNFNKPLTELIGKDKSDSIQLPMSFKDDNADMKLDFFDSDLSHLTDEKSSKNLMMSKSMHTITTGNSTMCTADSLNIKIASVKKVWETSEHNVGQDDANSSFTNSFVSDNNLDANVFNKSGDNPDETHEGYNQSPNQSASTTTNVCKVKPTQQVSGGGNQTVLSSTSHQPQLAMATQSLMGNPLSPPPMQHVPGAGVGLPQPQAYSTNQHIGYQAGLGSTTQFGMSAIPSPPTVSVLYNSTQPLQANAASLYGTFPMDQASVLGGQGRSQYSQYTPYGFGQTASSPYSTQSAVYLQTAPPHAPPPQAAQAPPPPDIYQNLRLSATAPFGQTQQLNNPSTVLITSTSSTLMSASVKPSTQQISAIGTKAGGVGQAYQQQSQQGQVYMYDPSIQANFLSNMQRGPGAVQSNVVPTLQPTSSYYSGSTGGQTGFFQQPGNSTIPSAQLGQHQPGGYGLQGFAAHNQTHTSAGFNSHFLSTPMQMAAAAITQQYRSGFLKNVTGQQIQDQSSRPQQLKSPGSQEALSSVFSGSQIPSPKSRQTCKHPPPQSSPTAQSKYLYQNMGNQQSNVQRYPTPIQRPINFQQNLGSVQNNVNQKHRPGNVGNKAPNRQFYSGNQNNSLSSQNEKVDDSKLNDNSGLTNSNNSNSSNSAKTVPTSVNSSSDLKDNIKEETSTLKD